MSSTAYDYISIEDTRRLEEETGVKHEWWDGVAIAMAGGTARHSAISSNIQRKLGTGLEGSECREYNSDMGVRSLATDRLTYPDVSVVCEGVQVHPSDDRGLTNPTVIVEVLSPTTEATDRGNKLHHYMGFPSVQHILLVATQGERVEHYERTDLGWLYTTFVPGESLHLRAVGVTLAVDDIYDRVPAEPPPPPPPSDD